MTALNVRPLHPSYRRQVEELVRSTGVFNEDEVRVALEVFDSGSGRVPSAAGRVEAGSEPVAVSTLPASRVPLPDYEFVGAFDGERLVGYACFGATPATDRTYDLYWIAVRPDAQRSGAGSALMNAVEQRLALRPARLLVIETSSRDDYAPTRRFYAKWGYEEAARLRDFYAPGDDRVVLSKRMNGVLEPLPA